jgi:hypothetical protein
MSYITLLFAHGANPFRAVSRLVLSEASGYWPGTNRKTVRSATRLCISWTLAIATGLIGVTQAAATPACRPILAIKDVQFSEMQKPALERKWTAIVSVDSSRCATTAGAFEVGFSRLKEQGVEVEFRQRFTWSSPSVKISVDFWADEAVESHWIDSVQECPCAR